MINIKEVSTHFIGSKIIVNENDITGRMIINNEIPEEIVFKEFIKHINKNSIIVDIGACYGQYTIICSKIASDGLVIAIEPNPYHFLMLQKGIKLNNLKNVILLNVALSDFQGTSKLFMSDKHLEGSTLFEEKLNEELEDVERISTDVNVITLDKLLSQLNIDHNKIDIIKMDSEGSEMKILKGSKQILNESKNLKLLTEFGTYAISASNENPKEFLNLLITRFKNVRILELNKIINKDNIDICSKIVCKCIFCQ